MLHSQAFQTALFLSAQKEISPLEHVPNELRQVDQLIFHLGAFAFLLIANIHCHGSQELKSSNSSKQKQVGPHTYPPGAPMQGDHLPIHKYGPLRFCLLL